MSCKISGILVRHTSFLKRKIILTFLRWHVLCTVHYRQSMVQSMHKNSLFTSVSQCCTNSGKWSLCWSTIHWLWQQWVASFKQVNNTPLNIWWSFVLSLSAVQYFIIWLAPLVSKIKEMLYFDWLYPRGKDEPILFALSCKKRFCSGLIPAINPSSSMLILPSWQNFSIVVVLLFILMDVNFVGIFNVPKSGLSQYPGILASHTCSVTHFYGWVCFRICISQSPIICFSKLSPFLLICFCYSHRCLFYSFAVLLCTNNCCKKWLLNARTGWDGYFTLLYLL